MANMSSYVDGHYAVRRSRYYAPRVSNRKAARIKAGRILVVVAILMLVFIKAAYGGGRTGTDSVVVQPGQTVWSIAADRYPDDDTRARVGEIVQLNQLGGQPIYAGEHLSVPAK
jgi:LysM domain